MRKISGYFTILLVVILFTLSFGAVRVSAEGGAYKRDHDYEPFLLTTGARNFYDLLADKEKMLYDEMYDIVIEYLKSDSFANSTGENYDKTMEYSDGLFDTDKEACWEMMARVNGAFKQDNPQFYFIGCSVSVDYQTHEYYVEIGYYEALLGGYDINYLKASLAEVERVAAKWRDIINTIPASKYYNVHKAYVIRQLVHDAAKYKDNPAYLPSQTMQGLFVERETVCAGYTQAFQYMCYVCGIYEVISDYGLLLQEIDTPHAWNLMKIDDEWYGIDATSGMFIFNTLTDVYKSTAELPFRLKDGKYTGTIYTQLDPEYIPSLYDFLQRDGYEYTAADPYEAGQKIIDGIKCPYGWMYILTIEDWGDVTLDEPVTDERLIALKDWIGGNPNIMCINLNDGKKSYMQYKPAQPMYTETLAPFSERYRSSNPEIIWANGDKAHKSASIKTSIRATTWKDEKGKVKQGKLIWLARTSKTELSFDASHKLLTKTDCKNTATVSNKGVISAKASGTVYVYAIDTGSMKSEEFIVTIKTAPKKITFTDTTDAVVKKIKIAVGETAYVYVNPEAKNSTVSDDCTYTAAVGKPEQTSYITPVVPSKTGEDILTGVTAVGLKNGKITTAKLNVINGQSGRKGSLSVQIYNSVTSVAFTPFTMPAKKDETASIKLTVTTNGGNMITTDKAKVYVSASEPVITGTKVSVTKCSGISAKLSKDGKTIELKATKDVDVTDAGVYIVYTNSVTKTAKCFKIG